jgi:hypothetical protein
MGKIAGWLRLEQLRLTKDQPDERLAARGGTARHEKPRRAERQRM